MEQQIELSAEGVWNDVAARLREALNDTTFQTWFGQVGGAKVEAKIVAQDRGPKIIIFKFRRRKNYRRKTGHRQPFTALEITGISG